MADKAKADAEVGEFTLTGSNRAVDVGAAAGQGGLFDAATAAQSTQSTTPTAVEKVEPAAKTDDTGNVAVARQISCDSRHSVETGGHQLLRLAKNAVCDLPDEPTNWSQLRWTSSSPLGNWRKATD